jgi:hypothetical protein
VRYPEFYFSTRLAQNAIALRHRNKIDTYGKQANPSIASSVASESRSEAGAFFQQGVKATRNGEAMIPPEQSD